MLGTVFYFVCVGAMEPVVLQSVVENVSTYLGLGYVFIVAEKMRTYLPTLIETEDLRAGLRTLGSQ